MRKYLFIHIFHFSEGTGGPISYVLTAFTVPVSLSWEDDGKEYACVVTMGDYQENSTTVLTVYCKLLFVIDNWNIKTKQKQTVIISKCNAFLFDV